MMKHIIKYIYVTLAILVASCSNDPLNDDANFGSGDSGMKLEMSLDTKGGEKLDDESFAEIMKVSTLKIYEKISDTETKLVRRYSPATECPEEVALLTGDYLLTLKIGSGSVITTDSEDMTYYGETDFTVSESKYEDVEVTCNLINTKISVEFKELEVNLKEDYKLTLAIDDIDNKEEEEKYIFTENGTCYFLLAEGETIAWRFEGMRSYDNKVFLVNKTIDPTDGGKAYTLTFEYNKYLNMGTGGVDVDTSTGDVDDHLSFKVQPALKSRFDDSTTQFTTTIEGDFVYDISGVKNLTDAEVTIYDRDNNILATSSTNIGATSADGFLTYAYVEGKDTKNGELTIKNSILGFGEYGSERNITVKAGDSDKEYGVKNFTVIQPGFVEIPQYNLWANTAEVKVYTTNKDTKHILNVSDGTNITPYTMSQVDDGGYLYTVTVAPTWEDTKTANGIKCYLPTDNTGIWAGKTYSYNVTFGDTTYEGGNIDTTGGVQAIPHGDMGDAENYSLPAWADNGGGSGSNWGSGNNSMADEALCRSVTVNGSKRSLLTTTKAGMMGIYKLAAGNIFFGQFSFANSSGTVYFGQPFTWTSRPKSLKLKYSATIGSGAIKIDDPEVGIPVNSNTDKARIYLAIVDWGSRHEVTAGMGGRASGIWDPAQQNSVDKGKIIGYASEFITKSTDDNMLELEIPIHYYDYVTKPSSNITLVISCASSAYGDYFEGSTDSRLTVDNFQFGY